MRLWLLLLPAALHAQNQLCAPCHAAIYKRYMQTGMARSSGRVDGAESFASAKFTAANGAEFEIDKSYRMRFTRGEAAATRMLRYFIGSGRLGRSYVYEKGGRFFQAPVAYYAATKSWNLSPGYETRQTVELTRAIEPACLQCHSSRGAEIGGGVTCERCHGPGAQHIRTASPKHIVNPARLPVEERESVCAQCHLTGAVRVSRNTRPYTPGAKLSDSIAIFVERGGSNEVRATSHFEDLAISACKTKSGGKLHCTTCHDPHGGEVTNAKCQTCHQSCSQAGPKGDCISCHMPKQPGNAGAHVPFTNHAIGVRTPVSHPLRPFWGAVNARDWALADPTVERLRAVPADAAISAQLAQALDRAGDEAAAAQAARQTLVLDPNHTPSLINLGTYQIQKGNAKEAMALWLRALAINPSLVNARLNLAAAQIQAGDTASAKATLQLLFDYEPDLPRARRLLQLLQ
ncbi:MAG: tetratricopeptide repeat protein [Acidobacteria bacterium]|nr:tetratricopeptide repeat protein [Acidobacteriota bacterium]